MPPSSWKPRLENLGGSRKRFQKLGLQLNNNDTKIGVKNSGQGHISPKATLKDIVSSMRLGTVGVFIPGKWANTKNQDFLGFVCFQESQLASTAVP